MNRLFIEYPKMLYMQEGKKNIWRNIKLILRTGTLLRTIRPGKN